MKLLRTLLFSKRDYALYLLRHRKGFAFALALFGIAIVMFVASPVADTPVLTALGALSTAGAVVEFGRQYRGLRSYIIAPAEVPYETLVPPPHMELVTLDRRTSGNDYALVAKPQLLRRSGLLADAEAGTRAVWTGQTYRLPPEMRSIAAGVLYGHYRRSNAPHFNGRVVRQATDLDSSGRVEIAGADYFDVLSTNYLAGRTVCDADGNCVVDGPLWLSSQLPDGRRQVKLLAESKLADPIGVSSLAFTADRPGRLIVVRQSPLSASSPGLWAPSSSGSMDERDVPNRAVGAEASMSELVVRAIERELVEESNVECQDIQATRLLGYFRWLNKGGKPEYVGVTRLKVRMDQLRMRPRVEERPWVKRVSILGELDAGVLRRGEVLQALPSELRGMASQEHVHLRDAASFPLFMCLRFLGTALNRDRSLRDWLDL